MRPVSVQALLISNVIQFGMTIVICALGAIAALAVAWALAGFPASIKPITVGLKGSSVFMSLISFISVTPSSLAAGYVAGRVARRRPALHGALSSVAWYVILICILLFGPPSDGPRHPGANGTASIPAFLGTLVFFGPPLLGAIGGVLAQRLNPSRDEQKFVPSMRGEQVQSVVRWK